MPPVVGGGSQFQLSPPDGTSKGEGLRSNLVHQMPSVGEGVSVPPFPPDAISRGRGSQVQLCPPDGTSKGEGVYVCTVCVIELP